MKLKLLHKLLIAMFASAVLVLVMVVLISRLSVGRGFTDFLNQQTAARLQSAVPELLSIYQNDGGWDGLRQDHRRFHMILVQVGIRRDTRPPRRDGRNGPPPRRNDRAGPPRTRSDDSRPPRPKDRNRGPGRDNPPARPGERAFAAGLLLAALAAWILARHLSRPVTQVAKSIKALASGDFKARAEVSGNDEIARLSRDVNRLARVLADNETARQRWMADIAHELRTPLSVLQGELEAIEDGIRSMDSKGLDSIRSEVKHINGLVDDLHDLMLSDSGALSYRKEDLDLSLLLQSVVDGFSDKARLNQLDLGISHIDRPLMVSGDEKRLRQLLHNLLENSIRYTDAGGRIEIRGELTGDRIKLVVKDSAPGVSQAEYEQVFDRFYRVETSRNRGFGGSGLGLSICRNIVEAHGGTIQAGPSDLGGVSMIIELEAA